MPTEHTSLKNTTPAGDSNTTNEMVVGKSKIYQRSFLIVAGSLLALLVLIAIAGTSGGQHLKSSTVEIFEGDLYVSCDGCECYGPGLNCNECCFVPNKNAPTSAPTIDCDFGNGCFCSNYDDYLPYDDDVVICSGCFCP